MPDGRSWSRPRSGTGWWRSGRRWRWPWPGRFCRDSHPIDGVRSQEMGRRSSVAWADGSVREVGERLVDRRHRPLPQPRDPQPEPCHHRRGVDAISTNRPKVVSAILAKLVETGLLPTRIDDPVLWDARRLVLRQLLLIV